MFVRLTSCAIRSVVWVLAIIEINENEPEFASATLRVQPYTRNLTLTLPRSWYVYSARKNKADQGVAQRQETQ